MFIKIVIILLLLIVAASLLGGRRAGDSSPARRRIRPQLRTLMLRVAVVLLVTGVAVAALHTFA